MDPSFKISFGDNLRDDLIEILETFMISCLLLTLITSVTLIFYSPAEQLAMLNLYKEPYSNFFAPPTATSFKTFLINSAIIPAMEEEIIYRGPIWFLIYYRFKLPKIKFDLTIPVIFSAGILLNIIWANTHTIFFPIFCSGIPLLVLVMRTKNIFAPMLCHFSYNLSIYILLQSALYLKIL